jgi:hypothetical protein
MRAQSPWMITTKSIYCCFSFRSAFQFLIQDYLLDWERFDREIDFSAVFFRELYLRTFLGKAFAALLLKSR